jgi:hypothetical protein
MKETISLSPVPVGEDCAQLGEPNYSTRALKECNAFAQQIMREHGVPPAGARLKITHNPHDFGTYLDLVVEFDSDNETASDWAYAVEATLPEYWDEIAMKELGKE